MKRAFLLLPLLLAVARPACAGAGTRPAWAGAGTQRDSSGPSPRVVRYELVVTDTVVRFTGRPRHAMAINGRIPGPVLTFTVGDTAEIVVHNHAMMPTGIHWHGVMLPNRFDGVPWLTQRPIPHHGSFTYRFPVKQTGTYWYHSHMGMQEQSGLYGALIFLKRREPDTPAMTVVLSDWTDRDPMDVERSLHTGTDWFAIRKQSMQSYGEALRAHRVGTKLGSEWRRMTAMDVSDVSYDRFLLNGADSIVDASFRAGDRLRLRVVNAGSSTYFWLGWGGGKMTVLATDGNDVQPVEVDRLIVAAAETYDIVVTIPEGRRAEFRATAEDRTGAASLWLGEGVPAPAPHLPRLQYFEGMAMMNGMMDMRGRMKKTPGMKMANQAMDMNAVMYPEHSAGNISTLHYGMLRATHPTTLKPGPWKELRFDLTGNMNRYVWTMNNRTVSETDRITIRRGENLRVVLYNNSMMRHPIHLHGHDFRVINGQGDFAPMKNVIDVLPMERDTLEFAASESGDWFFHCHLLYHMMAGMGRIFHYQGSPAAPDLPDSSAAARKLNRDDRKPFVFVRAGLETSGSDGIANLAQTRWKISALWHFGYKPEHGYEAEATVGRYLGRQQWWFPYVGFDHHYKRAGGPKNIFGDEMRTAFGQRSDKMDRHTVVAGVSYLLPMLFIADARVDGNGKFRAQLSRDDIPLTARLRLSLMANTDKEYAAGFRYVITKNISASTHYDSDMGFGAGLTFIY